MAAGLLKSIVTLAGVTAASQAMAILLSPVLSRLYTPAQFGAYGAIIAAGTLLSIVASLRFEMAIVMPEDELAAQSIATDTAYLSSLLCLVLALLWWATDGLAAWVPGDPFPLWVGYCAILFAWLTNFLQIGNLYASRQRRYGRLAVSNVVQQAGTALCSILLGMVTLPLNGLVWARMVTQALAAGLFILSPRAIVASIRRVGALPWSVRAATLWRYRGFAFYTTPATLLIALSREFLILIFTGFGLPAAAGAYALTRMALLASPQFLSAAIGQVFYREAIARKEDVQFQQLTIYFFQALATLICPFLVLLMLWGPTLFGFVFGVQWREAGLYAAWMAPSALFAILNSWSGRMFEACGQQRLAFKIQVAFDVLSMLVVIIALFQGADAVLVVALYATFQLFYQLTLTDAILRLVRPDRGAFAGVLLRILGLAGLMLPVHFLADKLTAFSLLMRLGLDFGLALVLTSVLLPSLYRQARHLLDSRQRFTTGS
ncbi:lipopolysaccharide biosynthesis protein [Bordetella avium]|uniref:O-antigen translocase n=1 Tax=Bordetella avium (strain 197N) TaxID=360910 RepID=Q2L1W4_BORA1|nr:oligosaccharide flippase family protein [Bordetella avium]AZY47760.1 hypothetical protein C0J09_00430 [Bordetella avium]AZY51129.1 hypothetical protein C0J07_00435 [Bordetella avium]RIQ15014.1 hypothetical protein D0432_02490 [Bordetella avium]RIQ18495.1 hypothetical protein D0850_05350 [Bordetella avium]RIQ41477.1 hypothetical protein D0848_03130 [Bordetella avium]